MSPNDELILMAVKNGYNTIQKISKKIGMDRQSVSIYLNRLKSYNLIQNDICSNCKQTKTYVPV